MLQFYGWLLLSAFLFILATVTGFKTKDAWDEWHKKEDISPKMEQSIKDSPNSSAYQAGRDLKIK